MNSFERENHAICCMRGYVVACSEGTPFAGSLCINPPESRGGVHRLGGAPDPADQVDRSRGTGSE